MFKEIAFSLGAAGMVPALAALLPVSIGAPLIAALGNSSREAVKIPHSTGPHLSDYAHSSWGRLCYFLILSRRRDPVAYSLAAAGRELLGWLDFRVECCGGRLRRTPLDSATVLRGVLLLFTSRRFYVLCVWFCALVLRRTLLRPVDGAICYY